MGEIFLARAQGAGGRRVAIKRMLADAADDPRFVGMFVDEARIAMRLGHPNIARVYEFGDQARSYFLAMEWVPGKTMRELVLTSRQAGHDVPVPIAARIAADVAKALAYAHELLDDQGERLGIVHRDVSPVNVMVRFDGPVKLLDFGLAKARTQIQKTRPGYVKGKFGYLAPEQVFRTGLDGRADIFALGLCMYEMLTGRQLFYQRSAADTLTAVRSYVGPPSIPALRAEVPEAVNAIVAKALAKDPAERFQTGTEMSEAIEQALGNSLATEQQLGAWVQGLFPSERYTPSVMPAAGPAQLTGRRAAPKATTAEADVDDVVAAFRRARHRKRTLLLVGLGVASVAAVAAYFMLGSS
jgi:serine/threonine-protein kinase